MVAGLTSVSNAKSRSEVHWGDLIALLVGIASLAGGIWAFMSLADGTIGFLMTFVGIIILPTVLIKGLHYLQNMGGDRGGDPDFAKTKTQGSHSSNYLMMEADREIRDFEKRTASD